MARFAPFAGRAIVMWLVPTLAIAACTNGDDATQRTTPPEETDTGEGIASPALTSTPGGAHSPVHTTAASPTGTPAAGSSPTQPPGTKEPIQPATPTEAPTPGTDAADRDGCAESQLLAKVREEGSLRLIVSLHVSGEEDNRQAIAVVQDALTAELEGTGFEVLRRYGRFPQIALRIDEAGLCVLLQSSLVAGLQVDEADPPSE